jgi:hypothetical protein
MLSNAPARSASSPYRRATSAGDGVVDRPFGSRPPGPRLARAGLGRPAALPLVGLALREHEAIHRRQPKGHDTRHRLVAVVGPAARSCRHRARGSPGRPRRSVRAVAANAQFRSTSASHPTRQAACRPSPCRSSSCGTREPVMGEKPVPRPVGTGPSSLILCPREGKCCRRPRASLLSMTALVVARAASWAGPWRYRRAGDAYATANPLTKVHPDRTRPPITSNELGARMEHLAVRLLRQAGWKIIDVRSMQFEGSRFIDIVARYGSEIGNFEVKLNSCRYIARQFFIDPVRELFGTRCPHVPRRYGTARPRATTAR